MAINGLVFVNPTGLQMRNGSMVQASSIIAIAQDLQLPGSKYGARVLDHVHLEIRKNRKVFDPKPYVFGA